MFADFLINFVTFCVLVWDSLALSHFTYYIEIMVPLQGSRLGLEVFKAYICLGPLMSCSKGDRLV